MANSILRSALGISVLLCLSLRGQIAPAPTRLEIEGPKNVSQGQPSTLSIKLMDALGHPAQSDKELKFSIKASGMQVDHSTLVIPKGTSSAQLTVEKQNPGLSTVSVEQTSTPGPGLMANTQIGLKSDEAYAPVPPLSLWITVQPSAKLKAGLEVAKIIIRNMDSRHFAVPAQHDIRISFPGLDGILSPRQIQIGRGNIFAEADLMEPQATTVTLNPISSPPMSITNDASSIEFISPIVGLRLIADKAYIKGIRHPNIPVRAGLIDGHGNWIASDEDRTIVLQVDPPNAGSLNRSYLTIPKGQSVVDAVFTPTSEGKATIKAVTGEALHVQNAEIEFYYAAAFFWLLAAIGGLIGGGVRNGMGTDHRPRMIAIHVLGGAAVGTITYLVAPLLIALSLKPAGLQNSSKIFESFIWGFLGGGTGIALLGPIFRRGPVTTHGQP